MILLFHVQFRKITNSTCENLPTGPKKFNAIQGGGVHSPPFGRYIPGGNIDLYLMRTSRYEFRSKCIRALKAGPHVVGREGCIPQPIPYLSCKFDHFEKNILF